MKTVEKLEIPHGNTQGEVNQKLSEEISVYLANTKLAQPKILDLPCGDASFLDFLQKKFQAPTCFAVEVQPFPTHKNYPQIQFQYLDLSQKFSLPERFDIVSCVSGVMEFENTSQFIQQCHAHMNPGALLLLTNDTIATIRDRISYALFGKFKRFAINLWPGFSTYKALSVQELYKMIQEQGFTIEKIVYTSARLEDWLLLPLALLIYPLQAHYVFWEKSPMPRKMRFQLFPLRSLLCRHYYFVARKV